jgi:hypothetical protein
MRAEIAMPLAQVFQIYTVGHLLTAWRNPANQSLIEQVFDSPQQARHAAATCAAWLGMPPPPSRSSIGAWWVGDEMRHPDPRPATSP